MENKEIEEQKLERKLDIARKITKLNIGGLYLSQQERLANLFLKELATQRLAGKEKVMEEIKKLKKCFLCGDEMEDNKEHKIYAQALSDLTNTLNSKE